MDMNLFDLAGVELVKKKYYNAAKVSELMENARDEYMKLSRENEELKAQLGALSSQKSQISDTLMSAQTIARQMLDDAKAQAEETARLAQTQAEETVKAAEKKAEFILAGATAVSVGTANFRNPCASKEVAEGIEAYMKRYQVEDINDLIGAVR